LAGLLDPLGRASGSNGSNGSIGRLNGGEAGLGRAVGGGAAIVGGGAMVGAPPCALSAWRKAAVRSGIGGGS
jgi:hypothetical protein